MCLSDENFLSSFPSTSSALQALPLPSPFDDDAKHGEREVSL